MRFWRKFAQLILIGMILMACSGVNPSSGDPVLEPSLPDQTTPVSATVGEPSAIDSETPEPGAQPQDGITPTPGETPLSQSEGALQASTSRTHYQIDAVLDYDNHHLVVEQSILYTNQSQDSLHDLLLVVEPSRYPEVFYLQSITWPDGQPVEYERDIGQVRVTIPQPLAPGTQIQINLAYELALPSPDSDFYGRPVPFGYSSRQTNLVDWYPFLPPYIDGQGWLLHEAGFFGEQLVYPLADFQVSIQLSRPNPDLVIATSASAEKDGQTYRYHHLKARNFAWSASHTYQVTEEQIGDVTVLSYAFPNHTEAGEAALKTTSQALALFSQLFGPYPHKTLSVVEADFLDGMEYDGLYFLSNAFYNLYGGTQGEYLVAIAAHETAHQWFFGLVGNDQALEPWLDEALCTYSERLYYENISAQALDWWYQYRVNYYQPRGWVDGSIYNPEGYRAYRDAVYLNGALFLDELRGLMGDSAFFELFKDYVSQNSGSIATEEAFFDLMKKYPRIGLTNLIEKYFADAHW
jgi:hypothetical protein